MAKEISQLIPESGIDVLQSLVGRTVGTLHAPQLFVEGAFVTTSNFSLALGRREYCVLENGWRDLPGPVALDEYLLNARLADWPAGIGGERVDDGSDMLGFHSTVTLRRSPAALTSVHVLDGRKSFPEGTVHFDHAVVFTRADYYRGSQSGPPCSSQHWWTSLTTKLPSRCSSNSPRSGCA